MKTYVVVPTKDRDEMLTCCIVSLRPQVEHIVVVNTRPDGKRVWQKDEQVTELPCYVSESNPPNISRWWNQGMDYIQTLVDEESWNILVVNDDVIAPPNVVETLSTEMRKTTAVLASPNMYDTSLYFHGPDSPMQISTRVTGYTYMLRGESGLRVDESMAWWWSDTDLEMRARRSGGALLVPNCRVTHLDPNGFTERDPVLGRQAGLDRETFIRKWGSAPW